MTRIAALLLALLATPAMADLPAPVPGIIKACLADGLDTVARRAALEATGIRFLAPTDRAQAVTDLVPGKLVSIRYHAVESLGDDPAANAQRLVDATAFDVSRAEELARSEDVFAAPDQRLSVLARTNDQTGRATCLVALPPGDWTADLAEELRAPPDDSRSQPWLTFVQFGEGPYAPWLVAYAPVAFGNTETLPQLVLIGPPASN